MGKRPVRPRHEEVEEWETKPGDLYTGTVMWNDLMEPRKRYRKLKPKIPFGFRAPGT